MKSYVKKPRVIQAIQYQVTNMKECLEFLEGKGMDWYTWNDTEPTVPYIKIETLEGTMECRASDWIIKGIKGEFYPCRNDIFEESYMEFDENLPEEEAICL